MITALAAAIVLASPRDRLVDRWLVANPAHRVASLAAPPGTVAPPVDLRTLVARELAVPGRYRLAEIAPPPAHRPWWAGIWDWVYRQWVRIRNTLFARVHLSRSSAVVIGDALLVVATLVILMVLLHVLRNAGTARVRSRLRPAPEPAAPADPDALYAAACAAAGRGEYGLASLMLFAAAIAALDRRGIVRGERSATVGDLRREVRRGDESIVHAFDAVAAPFVLQAYAERSVTAPQWERARDAFTALASAVQRG